MKDKKRKILALNTLLLLVVVIQIFPIILMMLGSFKSATELSSNPAGIPLHPTFNNYIKLLNYSGGLITHSFFNGIFISVVTTLLSLLFAAMAAYAFSKCEFKGKNVLFIILLATMMVPAELTIPPLYIIFSKIGLLNTYSVQIYPFVANVFALFMIRQYMSSIPNAIIEAAKIDGAGHIIIFFKVILPCTTPILSALGILVFLNRWNEFLWPTIMISKAKFLPIMAVLPSINDGSSSLNVPWELILTGCSIVTIPVIIIFFILQDKFLASATMGAVKE